MSFALIFAASAVKALGLLVLAVVFSALIGKQRARMRAVIWSSALVGALLLPLLGAIGPKFFIGVPQWLATEHTNQEFTARTAPLIQQHGTLDRETTRHPEVIRESHIDWMPLLTSLWFTGFCILTIRQFAGWLRIVMTLRQSRQLDPSWLKILARSMRRVGCRRQPKLVVSKDISTPATAFFFRPIILLPARCNSWLIERQEIVLQHELVHINRYDWLVRELAHLACSVYWFNPLAWWGLRCLVNEQEKACDEEVVAAGTRPSSYAATLLELARATTGRPAIPVLEMAHNHQLEGRIMRILNHGCRTPKRTIVLTAIVVFGFLVPTIAAVQIGEKPPRAASPELAKALQNLQDVERRIEPSITMIEDLDLDDEIADEVEAAIEAAGLDELIAQFVPMVAGIDDIEIDMEPFLDELEDLDFEGVDEAFDDIEIDEISDLGQLGDMIGQHAIAVERILANLEPMLAQIPTIEVDMAPFHERMEALEESLEPRLKEIEQRMRDKMEPLEAEVERIQAEIEPIEAEIEAMMAETDKAIEHEIAALLREHLGPVTSSTGELDEAAAKIADGARIRIRDDEVIIKADRFETVEILNDLLKDHSIGTQEGFDKAVAAAADELHRFSLVINN